MECFKLMDRRRIRRARRSACLSDVPAHVPFAETLDKSRKKKKSLDKRTKKSKRV